jgi:hypothetical protein
MWGGRTIIGLHGTPQMRGCHIEAYRLAGLSLGEPDHYSQRILFVEVRAEERAIRRCSPSGTKRTWSYGDLMSAFRGEADIVETASDVCF